MFSINLENATEDKKNKAKKLLERKILQLLLLIGADRNQYNNMKSTMQLKMAVGRINYPGLLEK